MEKPKVQEECFECGELTGKAGISEDSLYDTNGSGPYCTDCWHELVDDKDQRKEE